MIHRPLLSKELQEWDHENSINEEKSMVRQSAVSNNKELALFLDATLLWHMSACCIVIDSMKIHGASIHNSTQDVS